MTRAQIINKVKIKMNEISPFSSGDIVNNSLVEEMLDESTRAFLLIAPLHLIPSTEAIPVLASNTDGTGTIDLPVDFLRLASLKMAEWQRSVNHAIGIENPEYNKQFNSHTRGGIAKPVVAIAGDKLEYFSVKEDHTVDHFRYIADQPAEALPDRIIDGLTWQCGGDCFQILLEAEAAQLCFERVNGFIQSNIR